MLSAKKSIHAKKLIVVCLTLGLSACLVPSAKDTKDNFDMESNPNVVVDTLCDVGERCSKSDKNRCVRTTLAHETLAELIGARRNRYKNFSSLITAIEKGDETVDKDKLTLCLKEIKDLSCENALVVSSFNPRDGFDFSRIDRLLEAKVECSEIILR